MEILSRVEFARWFIHQNFAATVGGWCACPRQIALEGVEAYVGERCVAHTSTEERPDVQRHFGGDVTTLRSGFTLSLPFLELEDTVELRAVTSAGSRLVFHSFCFGELPNRDVFLFNYSRWSEAMRRTETPLDSTSRVAPPKEQPSPLVSLLLPAYNTPADFLDQCVESVLAQNYPHWELQIVDDGSTDEMTRRALARHQHRDARIHLTALPRNTGIAHATNRALALATGAFVGFVDHDDRLHPNALTLVVNRLLATGADAVYTDEEIITAKGEPVTGFFKPAFSPEFLRGVMYIGHFLCVRTSCAREIGGLDSAFNGVQDFEFALRLSERTHAIEHVPALLYQWRMSASSSALSGNVKGDMDTLQARAVEQHLTRIGRTASVEPLGGHRVRLRSKPGDSGVKSMLLGRTQACLENISGLTAQEVAVLAKPAVFELIQVLQHTECDRFIWVNEPLVIESWHSIRPLLDLLDDRSVGAAAPVLLARDGKVFASGVVVTSEGKLVPALRGFSALADGYNGSLRCNREVSAILSSCVAMRKHDLLQCLTESTHPFTDAGMAALCLKLLDRGSRILTCASLQVGTQRQWAGNGTVGEIPVLNWSDRFYNRHFDSSKGDYRLREPGPAGPGNRV
jgi:O-antigen biosynthesis protein